VRAFTRILARGAQITILNRHEQMWAWYTWLLQPGIELILGGDWVYFWGSTPDEVDLRWARTAGLCGRDPALATLRFSDEENMLANGLLMLVHNQLKVSRYDDSVNWNSAAETILAPIERNETAFFHSHAASYQDATIPMAPKPRIEGRVLVYDQPVDVLPNDLYWMLEAAIENQGLALEHGIQFRSPYAVAVHTTGDHVAVLAIRHWREEVALPIRLLFPEDLTLPLQGNENTVYVHAPTEQVDDLLHEVIAACNS
jgi:hypothetical protein